MTLEANTQLNDSDFELLSAYIDDELSAAERSALETRLQNEPLLAQTLAELQDTVTLLQNLAPLTPPRSFAVSAPKPSRFRPILGALQLWTQVGAVFAALLFVFSFGFDKEFRFGGHGTVSVPAAPQANDSAMYQSAPAATAAPAAAESSARMSESENAESAPMLQSAAPEETILTTDEVQAQKSADINNQPSELQDAALGALAQPSEEVVEMSGSLELEEMPSAMEAPAAALPIDPTADLYAPDAGGSSPIEPSITPDLHPAAVNNSFAQFQIIVAVIAVILGAISLWLHDKNKKLH